MANIYVKDRRKARLLFLSGGIAILACVALIVFFVHILVLRTEYREACLEMNDRILAAQKGDPGSIRLGERSCPLNEAALNYYDIFLLDEKTVVYNRKSFEEDDSCLILSFSDCRLVLKDLDAGVRIGLRWETPEGVRCYSVACGNYSFMQLGSYFSNLYRHSESAA